MNVMINQPNEAGRKESETDVSAQEISEEITDEQLAQKEISLRETLEKLELTPEQTSDDIEQQYSRDDELLRDVPPHHRNY
jgi:hypothetical protein